MNRRKFFKITSPLAATPLILGGTSIRAMAAHQLLQNTINCNEVAERILVIIHLKGGNDSLNTLVPISQYSTYAGLRPTLAIPDSGNRGYIPLDSGLSQEQQVGLHPDMASFKSLYEDAKVGVIQNVGYDLHNLSHFKSTELWMSGGDGSIANSNIQTGWMGRYLKASYPGYAGVPNELMMDPLGLQLGESKPSYGFLSDSEFSMAVNLTGQDPNGLYSQLTELGTAQMSAVPNSQYGQELQYAMNLQNSMSLYSERLSRVFTQGTNAVNNYNTDSKLANQLKTVAKLVSGGCKTKVFLLKIGTFDTHAEQAEAGDATVGKHARLLKDLSDSMKAFQEDITALGIDQKVLTVTFSEFGRKATDNGALGTDHGTVGSMFLFGSAVKAGMLGTNPVLANVDDTGQYSDELQYDYRQVYATLLQDWLGASDSIVAETQFDNHLNHKLPIIDDAQVVSPDCYLTNILPITLTYFNAEVLDEKVLLKWQTASEINNAFFIIERSQDGINFEDLFEVNGAGNSNIPINYSEWDETPLPGTSYYRLKQVDYDGRESTHNIEVVKLSDKTEFSVNMYPNPANRYINVAINSTVGNTAGTISIFTVNGQLVKQISVDVYSGSSKIPVNVANISNGQYLVKLELENGHYYTNNHLIQR